MWLGLTPYCLAALEPANRFSGRVLWGFSGLALEHSAANGTEPTTNPPPQSPRCIWKSLWLVRSWSITRQYQRYAGCHPRRIPRSKLEGQDRRSRGRLVTIMNDQSFAPIVIVEGMSLIVARLVMGMAWRRVGYPERRQQTELLVYSAFFFLSKNNLSIIKALCLCINLIAQVLTHWTGPVVCSFVLPGLFGVPFSQALDGFRKSRPFTLRLYFFDRV